MKKYEKNGKVAVILSSSGWASDYKDNQEMLFSYEIAECLDKERPLTKKFIEELFPGRATRLPQNLSIEWVDKGNSFILMVEPEMGSEFLIVFEDFNWIQA